MKKITSHPIVKNGHNIVLALASILLIAVLFYAAFFAGVADNARAGTTDNVSGWAWGSNIGWISFNCTDTSTCGNVDYGVSLATNGDMSGYAWSDNIGWITFNASDLSGCPSGACRAELVGNNLQGWARALSYGDGWDGWISLNGSNYGVTKNGNNLEGFSWDASNISGEKIGIGWIDWSPSFGGVVITPSSSTSQCSDGIDNDGDEVSDKNDPDCYDGGGRYNPNNNESGSSGGFSCTSQPDSAISTICSGGDDTGLIADTLSVVVTTCGAPKCEYTCDSSYVKSGNSCVLAGGGGITVALSANPVSVSSGSNSTLTWSSSNATSCEGSVGWSGSKPLSGSEMVGPHTIDTVYRLTCTNVTFQTSDDATVFVSASPPPPPPPPPPSPQCSDNSDNDSDNRIDVNDPGCYSSYPGCVFIPNKNDETDATTQCSNCIDDDGDGKVDFPDDPGCSSADDNREFSTVWIEK